MEGAIVVDAVKCKPLQASKSCNRDKKVKPALLPGLALALVACSASDDALYPSLAPRPIEKIAAADPVSAATPAAAGLAPDPSFATRLLALRSALAGDVKTLDNAIAAATTPAPSAERGSEEWAANQVALSRLQGALGGLETLRTDLGAIDADLAVARISGTDTRVLDTDVKALDQQLDQAIKRGKVEIDKRD